MAEEKKGAIVFETIHSKLTFQAESKKELIVENQYQNIVSYYNFSYEDVHALVQYLVDNFEFPIDVYIKPSQN